MTSVSGASGLGASHLYDSTDSLLRFAMRADATVTGLCGLAVAFAADPLSSLTGLPSGVEYGLGAAFVLYGLVVFSLAAVPNPRRAGAGVVGANVACTLAADLVPMTGLGVAAMLGSAVYTTVFAALQYLGVRRLAA